jgi:hypothetical protein
VSPPHIILPLGTGDATNTEAGTEISAVIDRRYSGNGKHECLPYKFLSAAWDSEGVRPPRRAG